MMSVDLEKYRKLVEGNPMSVATVKREETPNIAVVAYVKVVDSDKLLITDNYMKQTVENIRENEKVCLACFDGDWKGVKIFGCAEYFAEGEWVEKVKAMPENDGEPAKGAVVVTVERIVEIG
ncbi:pyridoxamine 5'-phosphate oxidase family protein [Candidatus Saccharibacteria bacterium]|nr:pyridoxamine 5'-phosphate oxidase family protein [Candidatus Saccharibacteria bacterium]